MFKIFVLLMAFFSFPSTAMDNLKEKTKNSDFVISVTSTDLGKVGSLTTISLTVNKSMTIAELIHKIQMKLFVFKDIKIWLPPFGNKMDKNDNKTLGECGIDTAGLMLKASRSY